MLDSVEKKKETNEEINFRLRQKIGCVYAANYQHEGYRPLGREVPPVRVFLKEDNPYLSK